MTDIRTRLADAIFTETTRIVFTSTGEDVEKRVAAIMSMSAQQLADVLLSLPGIAIVDTEETLLAAANAAEAAHEPR